MDSKEIISEFINAKKATTYEKLLSDGSITHTYYLDDYGQTALHNVSGINDSVALMCYLLTCVDPADVDTRQNDGCTPLWLAVYYKNTHLTKILIDFSSDRSIKSGYSSALPNSTPLEFFTKRLVKSQEMARILEEYFPSEE